MFEIFVSFTINTGEAAQSIMCKIVIVSGLKSNDKLGSPQTKPRLLFFMKDSRQADTDKKTETNTLEV
jgi:hypothetical protein